MNHTISHSTVTPDEEAILSAAKLCGLLILENGGETCRAEDTVLRICRGCGLTDTDVIAFPTGMILSLARDGQPIASAVQRVRKRTVNLQKLNEVNEISRALTEHRLTPQEAIVKLSPPKKPKTLRMRIFSALIAGLASVCFTLLFGGCLFDTCVAFVGGFLVQYISSVLKRSDLFKFAMSMIGGIVLAVTAVGATTLFHTGNVELIILGSIMPLLPGLAMTNAIRDTITGDLISGSARLAEVLLIALSLASGVGVVFAVHLSIGGVLLDKPPIFPNGILPRLLLDWLWCALSSVCYAILLNAPRKSIFPSAMLAAGGYMLYDAINLLLHTEITAYFCGTLIISLMSEILARRIKMPATIFLIPAIIPLVPGIGVYKTMLYLVRNNYNAVLHTGVQTLFIAGAMSVAIAAANVAALHLFSRRDKSAITAIDREE